MQRWVAYSTVLSVLFFVACNSSSSSTTTPTAPTISRVSISPSPVNVTVGGSAVQLSATLFLSDGSTVENPTFTWASVDTSVVTVDATGLATGVGVEVTSITATTVIDSITYSASTRVGVVSGSSGAASLTLSGTATYEDRAFNQNGFTGVLDPKPIPGAIVEVVAIDGFKVIGTGVTGSDGIFNVAADNSANGGGVYLRVVSRTDTTTNTKIEIRNNNSSRSFFAATSSVIDDSTSDPFLQTKNLLATVSSNIGGAFNILDVLTEASALVQTAGPCPDPTNTGCVPPLITVYWEPGSSEGTFFDGTVDAITLLGGGTSDLDSDEYDDVVIAHEYGHFILDKFSGDNSPGGTHSILENDQDIRLSWSEGWANFFAFAVLESPIYVDTIEGGVGASFDMETYSGISGLSSVAIYTTSEIAVSGTLWDVLDAVDVSESDSLDLSFKDIFQTVLAFPLTKPTTMETFWTQFSVGSTTSSSNSVFQTILKARKINLFEDTGETSETPLIVNDTSTQKHTLYLDASDHSDDTDVISFSATFSTTYTVSTLNLSNGADTFLTIKNPSGIEVDTNDNPSDGNFLTCVSTCPKNDATSLASSVTFTATETGTFTAEVTQAPNAPSSAGKLGSYEIQLTSP